MDAENILVVDDSPAVRALAERYLSEGGYRVLTAESGKIGLDLILESKPDLILVDQVMPVMDGIQFSTEAKKISGNSGTPIVLMGSSLDDVRDDLPKLGIVDSISKPFDPYALRAVVENALSRSRVPHNTPAEHLFRDRTGDISSERKKRLNEVSMQIAARMVDAILAKMPQMEQHADDIDNALVEALNPRALSVLAETLRDIDPTGGIAAFGGDLEAVPLSDVMQMLGMQGQTGELEMVNESVEVSVFFREGFIDMAQVHGGGREFLLGRFLVMEGCLTSQDLDLLLRSRSGGRLLGDQLVKLGYVTEEELRKALRRQTSELLYEVLRWRSGRYLFRPNSTKMEAQRASLGIQVSDVLLEGFRRVDEWRVIEGIINDFDTVVIRSEEAINQLPVGRLTHEEEDVLDIIDGESTIRELIEKTRMGSFRVCKILYQLISMKLVEKWETTQVSERTSNA